MIEARTVCKDKRYEWSSCTYQGWEKNMLKEKHCSIALLYCFNNDAYIVAALIGCGDSYIQDSDCQVPAIFLPSNQGHLVRNPAANYSHKATFKI